MPKGGPPKRPKPKNTPGRSIHKGMNPAESRAKFGSTRASANAAKRERKLTDAQWNALFSLLQKMNNSGSGRRPPNAR